MKTIFALLLFFVSAVQAQTIGIHTISAHDTGGKNNVNPGLYVRLDNCATAGVLKNSYRRWSLYAGYTMEKRIGDFSGSLTLGVITGYPAASVMALAVPSIAYHADAATVRLALIPRPPVHGESTAIHLMVERSF